MADFCTLLDKNASLNHPNVKACAKSSWSKVCKDFAHTFTFPYGKVWVAVQVCKNCAYIYLGRASSFFFDQDFGLGTWYLPGNLSIPCHGLFHLQLDPFAEKNTSHISFLWQTIMLYWGNSPCNLGDEECLMVVVYFAVDIVGRDTDIKDWCFKGNIAVSVAGMANCLS